MADPITPRQTPTTELPSGETPMRNTLRLLYDEVMQKNVLTPDEQTTLRTKYAKILQEKRDQVFSDTTHARIELQALLKGTTNGDQILAKLDPFLPGAKTVEAVKAGVAEVPEGVKA